MTKSFLMFLAFFVALGISIGGAFAGGVAFGRSQDNEATPSGPALSFSGNFGQQSPGGAAQGFNAGEGISENLAQLRQRLLSGDVNPEDLAQLRQQFGGSFGGGSGQGFAPSFGESVTGTVDTVDGNQVTVETADGPKTVIIGQETVIQRSTTGTLDDLQQGVRVAVFGGLEDEEGTEARIVVLIPEGGGGPFGEGLFFGSRQGQEEGAGSFGERRFQRDGGSSP